MSCILYYGQGARAKALKKSEQLGLPIEPPIGDDGLKVDDARHVVSLLQRIPIGIDIGTLVACPMDLAAPKTSDVLLKIIEDYNSTFVQPILWANDLGGVANTIKSRCLCEWVAGTTAVDDELAEKASSLLDISLAGEFYRVPDMLKDLKGKEFDLILCLSEILASGFSNTPAARHIWLNLRKVSSQRNPTVNEIVAALLDHE